MKPASKPGRIIFYYRRCKLRENFNAIQTSRRCALVDGANEPSPSLQGNFACLFAGYKILNKLKRKCCRQLIETAEREIILMTAAHIGLVKRRFGMSAFENTLLR